MLMKLIADLTRVFRRVHVYFFGANIEITRMIWVSRGTPWERWLEISMVQQAMREEVARHLGVEPFDLQLCTEKQIPAVAIRPGMWLGTTRRVYSEPGMRIGGTFTCHHYNGRPFGYDDGRRRLKLVVKAKGLLPWGPF